MSGYPDGNPKTAQGAEKVPLHLVPPSAIHYLALAFKDGAAKYGPYNWRIDGVSASVYLAAAKRHLDAWWDGENLSSDANVHHLAHVMACAAIVLDAESVGNLNDDRPPAGAASRLQAAYNTKVQPREDQSNTPIASYEEQAVRHHATEAPMPPAVEELIARAEDDDGPDGLKAGEAYRDHADGAA